MRRGKSSNIATLHLYYNPFINIFSRQSTKVSPATKESEAASIQSCGHRFQVIKPSYVVGFKSNHDPYTLFSPLLVSAVVW